MLLHVVRIILEFIGLCTVVWFVCVAREEYIKIRQEEKEQDG